MSTAIFNGIAFIGDLRFHDSGGIPRPNKDEWGVLTLPREMKGPAHLYDAFYASLKQGDTYKIKDTTYFLATWGPINDPVFPGVRMVYRGFEHNTLPKPLPSNDTQQSSVTLSVQAVDGNLGDVNGSNIVSATREIQYVSQSTTWRYISSGKPTGPRYNTLDAPADPQIVQSVITVETADGKSTRFAGATAPAALVTALTASFYNHSTPPRSNPILGTGYYECEETTSRLIAG